jgi:hypothetical protein
VVERFLIEAVSEFLWLECANCDNGFTLTSDEARATAAVLSQQIVLLVHTSPVKCKQ